MPVALPPPVWASAGALAVALGRAVAGAVVGAGLGAALVGAVLVGATVAGAEVLGAGVAVRVAEGEGDGDGDADAETVGDGDGVGQSAIGLVSVRFHFSLFGSSVVVTTRVAVPGAVCALTGKLPWKAAPKVFWSSTFSPSMVRLTEFLTSLPSL